MSGPARARVLDVLPFPSSRRGVTAAVRAGRRIMPMRGLVEVDVTDARCLLAGHGHETTLAAAGGEPAVRRGVPQPVRPEALDTRRARPLAQRPVQRVIGERLAAVAEPQRRGVGQPVAAAGAEVAVQRPGGLRAEGDHPALTALPPAHGGRAGGQVDVLGVERDDLSGPGTRLDHQPHERLIPAVAQVPARAGSDQRLDRLSGQRLDDLRVQLGRLEADQVLGVALALLEQPGGEAPEGELPSAGGGGLGAGLGQVGGEGVDAGPVEHRGAALVVGPGEEATHAVAVGLHRLGALALGAQVQLPGRQQAGEVDGHGARTDLISGLGALCVPSRRPARGGSAP